MKPIFFRLAGILVALYAFQAGAIVRYVDLNSANPTPPYTNWSTAAVTIQDAVDAANNGDLVLVTNGVYATGGRGRVPIDITNRVMLTKAVTLQSVNGPAVTSIVGNQASVAGQSLSNDVRCVGMGPDAVLSGFTLTNGEANYYAYAYGGGVANILQAGPGIVTNCVLVNNLAGDGGGGAYLVRLFNCKIIGNHANGGGGAQDCTLVNCTVVSNSASYSGGGLFNDLIFGPMAVTNCTIVGNSASIHGGGVAGMALYNCIAYYNSAPSGSNYTGINIESCCTTPVSSGSSINFTNLPLFNDLAAGDFHLQSISPCINAGRNSYAKATVDLDGNPRIVGGTVDIGAYEFQSPSSVLSYAWAQQYGLPTDGSADFVDTDSDGSNNWQEWIAGTVPIDASSVLKMSSPSNSVTGLKVSWQSVGGRNYFLQRATNLLAAPAFSSLQSNIVGQAGTTIYSDTTATNGGPYFYRVGVQ